MTSSTTDRRRGLTADKGFKAPVDLATTVNITLSGEQTIDGVLTSVSRVLVKNQTNTVQNGYYDTSSAAWTRCIDANGNGDIVKGQLVAINGGSQAGQVFKCTATNPITIDTSAITFAASLTTVQNASQVAFDGALTYAVQTMGHEGGIAPSIDSYAGVDPTGAADSAAAFNTAIAAALVNGTKRLRFPGTYKILSEVTLASGIYYEFSGTFNVNVAKAAFKMPAAASKITIDGCGTGLITGTCERGIAAGLASTCSDIRIRGLTITGCTLVGDGYTSAIFLDGVTRCWIEDNRCYGNGYGATTGLSCDILIYIAQNSFVNVRRNLCLSTAVAGNIEVYNATDVHIDFNTVAGAVTGASNNNGYGILNYSSVASACKRSTIHGNHVQNTTSSAIYCVDVTDISLAGNVLFNIAQTMTDVSLPVGGIALNGCTNAAVDGTVIHTSGKVGIATANGVNVSITGGTITGCTGAGVYLRGTGNGTVVKGVTLYDNGVNVYADATSKLYLDIDVVSRSAKTTFRGIDLGNVSYSSIRGVSSSNSREGLAITAGSNNVVTMVLMDNGVDAANTYDGITSAATNTKFIGCRSGNSAATGQRYGITSTGNYCTVQDNDCTRNQTDGTNISGTNVQKSGNRVSKTATPGPIQGSFVLVGGTVAAGIATDEARTGDVVEYFCVTAGGTQGIVRTASVVNETSFTPTSSQGADTSTYGYRINH